LLDLAHVELELFSNVDSSEMQPESWSALAQRLYERLPHFDGAVITHGTDTLAWTASALSFMLPKLARPVVLTGAQRPLAEVRTDARLNLIDAVTSALNGPREVTVCFDSRLYRGNRVRKVSAGEYDAFDSPNCPPLGVLGVETRFQRGLTSKGSMRLEAALDARVFLLKVFPGLDPRVGAAGAEQREGAGDRGARLGQFPGVATEWSQPVAGVQRSAKTGNSRSCHQPGSPQRGRSVALRGGAGSAR
jgi:L-asparaginase